MFRRLPVVSALALVLALGAAPASAQPTGFERSSFGSLGSPGVGIPAGALARGLSWFDRSRLSISTSVTVGSGFGGTQGLQVTRLGYQFGAPVALSVGLGNRFGGPGQMSPFLESLSLRYQPSGSTMFHFEFRDVRSPLQLTRDRDPFARDAWWGY